MFQLPPDQVVSVGRDKVNTISIADQTLSGQHFRIVPKGLMYYLVDLQSTNGTYLNGERVTLKELKPNSIIHAGQCDFTFKREQKRLN
jgi:pSer/pThr/pTyr-binding forkhead associated (FHA) protein